MPTASSSTSSPAPDAPERPAAPADEPGPPPFLGAWRNVYLLVAGELALTVIVFWLLARWAA